MAGLFSSDSNDLLTRITQERQQANQALGTPYGKYAGIVSTGAGLADIGADAMAGGGAGSADPRVQQLNDVKNIFAQVGMQVGNTSSSQFYTALAEQLRSKYPDQASKAEEKAKEMKKTEYDEATRDLKLQSVEARKASLKKLFPDMDETTVNATAADEEGYRKLIANKYQPEKSYAPSDFAKTLQEAGYKPGTPEYQQKLKEYADKKLAAANGDSTALKAMDLMLKQMELQKRQMDLDAAKGKQEQNAKASKLKGFLQESTINNNLKTVDEAIKLTSGSTAGVGAWASAIPATSAKALKSRLTTIKANLGFDRLQQMREASPTGGALGQVAVQELESLQASVASLDQELSPAELRASLAKVQEHYNNWLKAVKQAESGGEAAPAEGGGGGAKPTMRFNPETGKLERI